jgi:glycosyltransferase involved in cell wall biosynthesis
MRILFLSHYFPPEGNAPATRVSEMTRRWTALGHDVTVITGVPNVPDGVVYEGYRNRWYQRETWQGVDVRRVWTYLAANQGTARRILNYVSFMLTATIAGLFAPRPDVVIATSPQFFCGWSGVLLSKLRRRPFVLEIRDLWPESILAVGAMNDSRLIAVLEWLELRMYAAATWVVTVGEGYRRKLLEKGVPPDRISVIPNGVDRSVFDACIGPGTVRDEFDLGDRFVCAYVGTIGMGSGLAVVIEAARRLARDGRDDLRFLLVGDGAIRGELEAIARDEGLASVVFTGRQPKSRMPEFLAATDACLVHLSKTDLFKTVLPSKIFEACAMRRPIVLGVEGFAAELIDTAGAGLCIEPENAGELLDAVTRLAQDPELRKRLGEAGHANIAEHYDYAALSETYATLLEELTGTGEPR